LPTRNAVAFDIVLRSFAPCLCSRAQADLSNEDRQSAAILALGYAHAADQLWFGLMLALSVCLLRCFSQRALPRN
jgi:hypothetical protein